MDYLYKNKKDFSTSCIVIGNKLALDPSFIEKDYYICELLRFISSRFDYIVFKGGTSLSKAQKVINRFSEDIDLSTYRKLT